MSDWKKDKDSGPWDFTEQSNKWGYLNNPFWTDEPEKAINYTGNELNEPQVWSVDKNHSNAPGTPHTLCGHWHKRLISLTSPIITTESTFAIIGTIFLDTSDSDISAIVFNKDGIVWSKAYHIEDNFRYAYGFGITEVSDGLILGGQISVSYYQHNVILKVDKDTGDLIWSTVLDQGNADEYISSVKETSDGGIICTSKLRRGGANYDIGLIKLTSTGSVSWTKYFDGTTDDYGRKVIELSSGDLLICGWTSSLAESNITDALIMKLNSSGTVLWSKRYNKIGTNDLEAFHDIQETSDNGFIAIGQADEASTNNRDILVVKTTSDGTISWSMRITADNSFNDRFGYKIREVSDGYVLMGYHPNDIALTKITLSGAWSWSKKLISGAGGQDIFYGDSGALTLTDVGICFVGIYYNSGISAYDLLIGYVDFDGEISGCSYLTDYTPVIETGEITATGISITMSEVTINEIAQTVKELDKSLVFNNFCLTDPYFAHTISTGIDANIEPYDMIEITL